VSKKIKAKGNGINAGMSGGKDAHATKK